MNCQLCLTDVDRVRSVLLRQWLEEYHEWGVTKAPPPPGSPDYQQYVKNVQFRRAFICDNCYGQIDASPDGCATLGVLGEWNLAGRSRGGKAGVYDRRRWEAFQRMKAEKMGIQL